MPAATMDANPWHAARPEHGWPVWGHDGAVANLQREIVQDRVRHAYLVAGPEGIGKTTLALAFAQVLCCLAPPAPGLACGACRSCQKIARGVHPDVVMVSLASQAAQASKPGGKNTSLTIETVRELAESVSLRPLEGRWRIVLVDDAELMQEVAQEALLKTLEEPPSYVVIMLLANDGELLLPTIRSRCQLVDLRPVSRGTIVQCLEARGIDPAESAGVVALAAGRPGLAMRAIMEPAVRQRRREAIERALGWIESSGYDRMVAAYRLGDIFSRRRDEVFADLDTLLGIWRDVMLLRASQSDYLIHRGDAARLGELAGDWSLADVHGALCAVQSCIGDLEANVRPRLALENMVLQWPIVQAAN